MILRSAPTEKLEIWSASFYCEGSQQFLSLQIFISVYNLKAFKTLLLRPLSFSQLCLPKYSQSSGGAVKGNYFTFILVSFVHLIVYSFILLFPACNFTERKKLQLNSSWSNCWGEFKFNRISRSRCSPTTLTLTNNV